VALDADAAIAVAVRSTRQLDAVVGVKVDAGRIASGVGRAREPSIAGGGFASMRVGERSRRAYGFRRADKAIGRAERRSATIPIGAGPSRCAGLAGRARVGPGAQERLALAAGALFAVAARNGPRALRGDARGWAARRIALFEDAAAIAPVVHRGAQLAAGTVRILCACLRHSGACARRIHDRIVSTLLSGRAVFLHAARDRSGGCSRTRAGARIARTSCSRVGPIGERGVLLALGAGSTAARGCEHQGCGCPSSKRCGRASMHGCGPVHSTRHTASPRKLPRVVCRNAPAASV
jgi:hypothetical protein